MTTISALPTAPARSQDSATYIINADATMAALPSMVTQINTISGEVNANAVLAQAQVPLATAQQVTATAQAVLAAASASAAALSTGVTKWINGTTYTQGQCVWSPTDFQNYRCAIAGTSTTDPAADLVNWRVINYVSPWAVKTGAYTAVQGDKLMVNTTSAAISITLPASPVAGITQVLFKDYAAMFNINNLTVLRNGNNIEGLAQDMTVSQAYRSFGLLYIDATRGWVTI